MRLIPVPVALTLCALLVACGGDGGPASTPPLVTPTRAESPASPAPASPADASSPGGADPWAARLVLGLCRVAYRLEAGDIDGAEAAFEDEVHDPLHELGDRTQDVDPVTAAEVLETKQRVEAGFADPASAGELTRSVAALLDASGAALEALGIEAPDCPA